MAQALVVPVRCDSDRNRPDRCVLPDWSLPVLTELVTFIFEFLAETVQLWPSLMARRARQAIFSGESRYGLSVLHRTTEEEGCQQNSKCQTPLGRGHRVLLGQRSNCREVRTIPQKVRAD